MRKFSKYIIATICLSIVVLRIIFPKLNFDLISLSLVGIETLTILIKEPENIFKNTKKVKFGSFELELQELNEEAKIVEKNIASKKPVGLSGPVIRNSDESKYDNYRNEIIKQANIVENELREIYTSFLKPALTESISNFMVIEKLREEDKIDYETAETLRKFFNIRNQAVHDRKHTIGQNELLSFTEIGERMIKILNLVKTKSKGLKHYIVN